MKTIANLVLLSAALHLGACSTNGGMYHENDPHNGEFSAWRTIALPFAVLGIAAVGAAAGAAAAQPAYTYQPVYVVKQRPLNCTSTSIGYQVNTHCW